MTEEAVPPLDAAPEPRPEPKATVKRMPLAELQKWAVDYLDGRIICSVDLQTGDLDEDTRRLGTVFLPLRLGLLSAYDESEREKIALFWAYKRDAAPISSNGLPMFLTVSLIHEEDWAIIHGPVLAELQRRAQFRLPGLEPQEAPKP